MTNNEAEKRYEARVDGELAGSAYYDTADDLIVFTHTEVDEAFEGHGVGSALARFALDDVRARRTPQGGPALPLHQGLDRPAPGLPGPAGVDGDCPQVSAQDRRNLCRQAELSASPPQIRAALGGNPPPLPGFASPT